MRVKNQRKLIVAAATTALLALGACSKPADSTSAAADAGPACNRQCLIDATNAYVAAIVAHDPARAPLAQDVDAGTAQEPGQQLDEQRNLDVPTEVGQGVGAPGGARGDGGDTLQCDR